jgi:hypothetical protein
MNIHYAKTNLLTGENNDLMTIETIKGEVPSTLKSSADFICSRLVGKGLLDSGYSYYSLSFAGRKLVNYLNIKSDITNCIT